MGQTNKKSKKAINIILAVILQIIIIVLVAFAIHRGYMVLITPDECMITRDNYIDYQKRYECSGYASAYVLRSLGVEVDGIELYNRFTDKNPDGTLAPGYLWENLRDMGYKCNLRIGSITDLKYVVNQGISVVVLIRLNTSKPYLHYVPVVGYDENYIYIVDSLSYMVNVDGEKYNRKIAIEEFKELWKTDTFVLNNIYLTIGISENH